MGKLFYTLFVKLYPLGAGIASVFNGKARLWVQGRKNIFATIKSKLAQDHSGRIWVHCSSLGEFEQGRPLIEAIKKNYPQYSVVLTFFSPSGYENEKNNDLADHVFYMPIDSTLNAQKFYDSVQPKLVVFIKYEFWYYYLNEAKKRNIPLLLVSGIFRKSQPFFQWYGGFYKEMLRCFTQLFVQTETAQQLLQSININNAVVSGDTRFDRVLEVADHFKTI
ncbi:MAG: glycosyltransferase N-terminal domain-containing protein, partial [Panacibacter sp.]